MKTYYLVLLFLKKILFLFWAWPNGDPIAIVVKVGPKNSSFWKVLPYFFSRTTGFQLQLLILIESSKHILLETSIKKPKWVWSWDKIWAKLGPLLWKKVKKQAVPIAFFHILHGWYILKSIEVVVQTPGWKFKANTASWNLPHLPNNAVCEGH